MHDAAACRQTSEVEREAEGTRILFVIDFNSLLTSICRQIRHLVPTFLNCSEFLDPGSRRMSINVISYALYDSMFDTYAPKAGRRD